MTPPARGIPREGAARPLAIDIERDGRTTMLRLAGELDLASAEELRRNIFLALDRHDADRVLLDLSELSFIDSSGLAVVVWAHQLLAGRGGQLRLQYPQPPVRRVLQVSGLHTRLHITDAPPPQRRPRAVRAATTRAAARSPAGNVRRPRPV